MSDDQKTKNAGETFNGSRDQTLKPKGSKINARKTKGPKANASKTNASKTKGSQKNKGRKGRRGTKPHKTFADLMGPPPLLSDEDPAQYFALYQILRLKIDPRHILEEIYVRQIMDDAWLVTRYRRMNAHILNMAQPNLGDGIRLKIDRYRNTFMGSEELLDQRTENLILHDFSQFACCSHPSDMIAKQFEKRIVEINLIEGMISRCMERMRRSHITLEDARAFLDQALEVVSQDASSVTPVTPASQASDGPRCGVQDGVEDDCENEVKAEAEAEAEDGYGYGVGAGVGVQEGSVNRLVKGSMGGDGHGR